MKVKNESRSAGCRCGQAQVRSNGERGNEERARARERVKNKQK
jgi:hypothetical protein